MFEQKTFTHKKVVITSDLLSENTESGRYYVLEDGKKLPSVTTVTGWKKNKFFAKWRANNPKEAKRVTRRGNKLHSVIEEYVNLEVITGGYLNDLLARLREDPKYHSAGVALTIAFILFGEYVSDIAVDDIIGEREHELLKSLVHGAKMGLGGE